MSMSTIHSDSLLDKNTIVECKNEPFALNPKPIVPPTKTAEKDTTAVVNAPSKYSSDKSIDQINLNPMTKSYGNNATTNKIDDVVYASSVFFGIDETEIVRTEQQRDQTIAKQQQLASKQWLQQNDNQDYLNAQPGDSIITQDCQNNSSVRNSQNAQGSPSHHRKKVGYLSKERASKWKRKSWHQRWFVLDMDSGILSYYKYATNSAPSLNCISTCGLPDDTESVNDSSCTRGSYNLKNAKLTIRSELSRGTPTPFCFQVVVNNKSITLCAENQTEFHEWTKAISSMIHPEKSTDIHFDNHKTSSESLNKNKGIDDVESSEGTAISGAQRKISWNGNEEHVFDKESIMPSTVDTFSSILMQGNRTYFYYRILSIRSGMLGVGVLYFISPVSIIIKFGDWQVFVFLFVLLNVFLVWLLWIQYDVFESNADRKDEMCLSRSIPAQRTKSTNDTKEEAECISRDNASDKISDEISVDSEKDEPILSSLHRRKFEGLVNGTRAIAGCSLKHCSADISESSIGCWSSLDATRFKVRQGPNYRKTKIKASSKPSLLELLATDVFYSDVKIDNIGSIVQLPEKPTYEQDFFIINCQVPNYSPSNPLWGEKQGDGPGFNLVMYFWISPEIRKQLDQDSPSECSAINLLRSFMNDDRVTADRFKAIGIVANPAEQQLGRTEKHLLDSYNGQPILTRPQHRMYRGKNYYEVDIDAHEFNYVARKGLSGISNHMCHMIVDFGFVLEGQTNDELPEQIIGCVRLCHVDLKAAPNLT